MHRTSVLYGLIGICSVSWTVTAIAPHNIEAWALEQIASILCIGLIVWTARTVTYSLDCWVGLAAIFVLHTIGTHYTYSLTPYDNFLQSVFGISVNETMGWDRNHYDRIVHFLFGLATTRVFFEYFKQRSLSNATAWFVAFNLVVSTSAIYELMEWAAAVVFAGESGSEAGALYLGTQGDIWDAQVDMFLAAIGSVLSITLYACATWYRKSPVHAPTSDFP